MHQMKPTQLLSLFAAIRSIAALGLAQAPVGTITGTVVDETGAVVPSASVSITNKSTGAERKLTSSPDGSYSAPALPAGLYPD